MSTRIASSAAVLQIVAKERAWNALGGVVLRAVGGVRCVCVLCLLKIMGDLCVLCVPGYVCALVVRVLGDGCVVLGDGCCAEVARAKSPRCSSTTRWTRRRRSLLNNKLDPENRPLTHGPGPRANQAAFESPLALPEVDNSTEVVSIEEPPRRLCSCWQLMQLMTWQALCLAPVLRLV